MSVALDGDPVTRPRRLGARPPDGADVPVVLQALAERLCAVTVADWLDVPTAADPTRNWQDHVEAHLFLFAPAGAWREARETWLTYARGRWGAWVRTMARAPHAVCPACGGIGFRVTRPPVAL